MSPAMQTTMTILQMFLAFGNVCIMLYALRGFILKPRDTMDERIAVLEVKVADVEKSLLKGNDKFRTQNETNEILTRSVLALIEFEMQYCLTEHKEISKDLEKTKEDLHQYLSRR